MLPDPPEPWGAFLAELDSALMEPVELHCLGGFVVSLLYGHERPTHDIDVLVVRPDSAKTNLQDMAGEGSLLFKKHHVYLQIVTLQAYPEDYEARLIEVSPSRFQNLRLFALDPYDLALSKLLRNSTRDREDVRHLGRTVPLDPEVLRARYEHEMGAYVANREREGRTLQLWIDMLEEDRRRNV